MATNTEQNASVVINGDGDNTVNIYQQLLLQQDNTSNQQTPPVAPSLPSTALPAPQVTTPADTNEFFPRVDAAILARAEEIKKCWTLEGTNQAVAQNTPAAAPEAAAYNAERWNGTDGKHINSLSPENVMYLQTLLNKETGANLPIDGVVTPELRALAVQEGILGADGAIKENALEALDKKHNQPATQGQQAAQNGARQLDDLSQSELNALARLIVAEGHRSVQTVEPVMLTDEIYQGATEIGVRNPYNGNLDEAKLQALFEKHGLTVNAPVAAPEQTPEQAPAQQTQPQTQNPTTDSPSPPQASGPAADKYSTHFDGLDGLPLTSLSPAQIKDIQTIIASYKDEHERYNIAADGVVGPRTIAAAEALGIIDQNGAIREGWLEGWQQVNERRNAAPAQQSSAEPNTLQTLVAQFLPTLPTFEFSSGTSTVATETINAANTRTAANVGR
jgi:hypothetical protein